MLNNTVFVQEYLDKHAPGWRPAQSGNAGTKKHKPTRRKKQPRGRLANGLLPSSRWSKSRKASGETNGNGKGHRRGSKVVLKHDPTLDRIIEILEERAS